MSSGRTPRFRHGDVFVREFAFLDGTLRFHGTVGVDREGGLLLLWDVDVRPIAGDRLVLGAAGARRVFASLCALVAADGFETLVVNGYRINGANPSRFAEVALDCGPSRLGPRPVDES